MRDINLAVAGIMLLAVMGPMREGAAQETEAIPRPTSAAATIINAQGKEIGRAKLAQVPNGVLIQVQVSGLKPGEHGFHIHETGKCETPSFESAGDHFNPTDHKHGIEVDSGPHAGDLPNLVVGSDGSARLSPLNPYVTLEKDKKNSLLKDGGTALIIHSGVDDYQSQPSGKSGQKVGCGEIRGS
jgi:Cu-Zn family superoxide dismutase